MVLHDSHAEILALRGLNRWLLHEMKLLLDTGAGYVSEFLELQHSNTNTGATTPGPVPYPRPYRLKDSTSIYLFTTTAPCGDASMDLLISSSADATPWPLEGHEETQHSINTDTCASVPLSTTHSTAPGRGFFSLLGAVRRKPARGDAEATMSKSCTDKIALKQFTGLASFPVDALLQRDRGIFLTGLVVYSDQYCKEGYERAWGRSGRLRAVADTDATFVDVYTLPPNFPRFVFDRSSGENWKSTNISAVYVAGPKGHAAAQEVLVNGVKQGYKQFEYREGKGSVLCRRKMVELAIEIGRLLARQEISCVDFREANGSYSEMKKHSFRRDRLERKKMIVQKLGGWASNSAEDDFEIVANTGPVLPCLD